MPPLKAQLLLEESLSAYFPEMVFTDSGITVQLHRNTQLYKDGDFIQLLEGERTVVQALYQTIVKDPRHRGATMLLDGEADERMFSDWSMGFRDLSDPAVQATPGFSQFMNSRLVAERFADDPTGCLGLLALFKPKF